jgi:metallophosphoesterase superfamily enzyme
MIDLPLFPDLLATPYRFAWHPATRTAILADLHLGAFALPDAVGAKTAQAWRQLAARQPRQVILAGDILDDPRAGSPDVEACRSLLGLLGPQGAPGMWGQCRVILTPGNHDPSDLAMRLGAESAPEARVGRYVVSHGHEPTAARPQCWIVGHQHPAVVLRDRVRQAKMACYAVCAPSARRPAMVLVPAFSSQAGGPVGTNLMTGGHWILPVPRPASERIRVLGLVEPATGEPRVLDFGPLSGLQD